MSPPPALDASREKRPRLVLIGGGARSGKSAFALQLARSLGDERRFIATAQALDDEMGVRIARHQAERGPDFSTVEAPIDLEGALIAAPAGAVVLVDCLTLWITNLQMGDVPAEEILRRVDTVARLAAARSGPTLVVTNEVGLGLVPATPLGRAFRDLTGSAHQRLGAAADAIYAALLGVVLRLHPGPVVSFRTQDGGA